MTPKERARQSIDRLLTAAGWAVQDFKAADIHAARGVAIREFVLDAGQGFADYLLYVDGKAAGVIEAKKQGATLTGVEIQSARYAQGLPATLPAWRRPLPFIYGSNGPLRRLGVPINRFLLDQAALSDISRRLCKSQSQPSIQRDLQYPLVETIALVFFDYSLYDLHRCRD
jgi:hypothetical protein